MVATVACADELVEKKQEKRGIYSYGNGWDSGYNNGYTQPQIGKEWNYFLMKC